MGIMVLAFWAFVHLLNFEGHILWRPYAVAHLTHGSKNALNNY
jgi:hypothetical protein